jgi:hypothetical protein
MQVNLQHSQHRLVHDRISDVLCRIGIRRNFSQDVFDRLAYACIIVPNLSNEADGGTGRWCLRRGVRESSRS